MARIRVLIADDHAVVRAGLRALINAQPDMAVAGEAADGEEAVAKAGPARADVALMDLTMPGMSGLRAIARLRRESPRTRVLALTMHDDPAYVRAVLDAGGAGYVTKEAEASELLSAIRAVHKGRTVVELAHRGRPSRNLLRAGPPPRPVPAAAPRLSARERQVLELLAQGHTSRQIARRLALSVKTVETYRARIAEKLGLRTRADIIRFALDTGLLRPRGAAGNA